MPSRWGYFPINVSMRLRQQRMGRYNSHILVFGNMLTKIRQPALHRRWSTRDRAANRRLFRLASEVLRGIEAGVFHPNVGWQCKDCAFRSRCRVWVRVGDWREGVAHGTP